MKICVYAICKNEIQNVDIWLDNMSEADYIVVLDTGSTDGTYEKLKADSRVTRVEQKIIDPWRFDVARNESMKLVPDDTDIYVCTDFDEQFESGWAQVLRENWVIGTHKRALYTYYWGKNSTTGLYTNNQYYDKIHDKDYVWKYPVHEILYPVPNIAESTLLNLLDKIVLYHNQDDTKPRAYYMDLLKLRVEETPDDLYSLFYIAREYMSIQDYTNALRYLEKQMKYSFEDYSVALYVASMLHLADCYTQLGRTSQAIKEYDKIIQLFPSYIEPYIKLAAIYTDKQLYGLSTQLVIYALNSGVCETKNDFAEIRECHEELPYVILGYNEMSTGNFGDAIKHFDMALMFNKNNQICLQSKAMILNQIIQNAKND